jgi:VanZ family protein
MKFKYKIIMSKIKILFQVLNVIFIILYVYPGSILGYFIYRDFGTQPQVTRDFLVSSNHVYAFLLLSLIGLIAYYKSSKEIILNYLILISIILEVLHLVIPNRSFQYSDLFGNIIGVLLSILLINIYNFWRKK